MITVPKIQIALKREYNNTSIVMAPNIFLWSSFESDFVRVTKSGYGIEYEIKLSRSDFKADFKKSNVSFKQWNGKQAEYVKNSKHDWLIMHHGVFMITITPGNYIPNAMLNSLTIGAGYSCNELMHAVVCQNGKVIHDPLLNSGLTYDKLETFDLLVKYFE